MSYGGARLGTFNRKIEFYKPIDAIDSKSGQKIPTSYQLDFPMMADVTAAKGSEKTKNGREEMATMYFRFKMHFNPKVTVKHKVKFDGNFFDIQNFYPSGSSNRRLLIFMAELIDAIKVVTP